MFTGANSLIPSNHDDFEGDEGIDVRSVTLLYKRYNAITTKFQLDGGSEQIGKCQRQHYKEILKFWRSLQTSIRSNSHDQLVALVLKILQVTCRLSFAKTKGESAMDNPEIIAHVLEMFKLFGIPTDSEGLDEEKKNLNQMKIQTVESSVSDHDNDIDTGISKKNNVNEIPLVHKESSSMSADVLVKSGGTVEPDSINLLCAIEAPIVNQQIGNEKITEEYQQTVEIPLVHKESSLMTMSADVFVKSGGTVDTDSINLLCGIETPIVSQQIGNEKITEESQQTVEIPLVHKESSSMTMSTDVFAKSGGTVDTDSINLLCGIDTPIVNQQIGNEGIMEECKQTVKIPLVHKESSSMSADVLVKSGGTAVEQDNISLLCGMETPIVSQQIGNEEITEESQQTVEGLEERDGMNAYLYENMISKQRKNDKGSKNTALFKNTTLKECKEGKVTQPTKGLEENVKVMNSHLKQRKNGKSSTDTTQNSKPGGGHDQGIIKEIKEKLVTNTVEPPQRLEEDNDMNAYCERTNSEQLHNDQGSRNRPTAPNTNRGGCKKKMVNEGKEELGFTAAQRTQVNHEINNSHEEKCKGLMETVKNKDDIISALQNEKKKLEKQTEELKKLIKENRNLRVKVEKNDKNLKGYYRQVTDLVFSVQNFEYENGVQHRAIDYLRGQVEISEAQITSLNKWLSERERDQSERNANAERRMQELVRENCNLNEQTRMYRENLEIERGRKGRFRRLNRMYRENFERERGRKERFRRLCQFYRENLERARRETERLERLAQHAVGALAVVGFTQDVEESQDALQ